MKRSCAHDAAKTDLVKYCGMVKGHFPPFSASRTIDTANMLPQITTQVRDFFLILFYYFEVRLTITSLPVDVRLMVANITLHQRCTVDEIHSLVWEIFSHERNDIPNRACREFMEKAISPWLAHLYLRQEYVPTTCQRKANGHHMLTLVVHEEAKRAVDKDILIKE